MKNRSHIVLSMVLLVLVCCGPLYGGQQEDCFSLSLHHTGEGMRYWYEAEDGFMALTGIPYDQLGCKHCHAKSCNACHLKDAKKGLCYSLEMAKRVETCYQCHARESAAAQIDKARDSLDVHLEAGMTCADCHTPREMHGDGNFYKTMRDPKAKDAACVNCHTPDSEEYPVIPETKSHIVHKNKLDCNACHVQGTMTCYNCHFGPFLKTGSKAESFYGKIKDFLLLVKYRGKITSGGLQTLVSSDNAPFIIYAPYLTHSIRSPGRKCEECHGTEAVNTMASGKTHAMAELKDGKTRFYKGIVPVVPDRLKWPFFNKKDGKWVPLRPKKDPLIQMGLYAEPLNQDELNRLKVRHTYGK